MSKKLPNKIDIFVTSADYNDNSTTHLTTIKSTHTEEEIRAAYFKGAAIIGVDVVERKRNGEVLDSDDLDKYENAGIDINGEPDEKGCIDVNIDDWWYLHFYISTAEKGDPSIEWDNARPNQHLYI
jgi:hypothetical protein